jgi:hypothetical protein
MADPALACYFALSRKRPPKHGSEVREVGYLRLLEAKVWRTQ